MDYLYSGEDNSDQNPKQDAPLLEMRRREFELELLAMIQEVQENSSRTARLNFATTVIFGIIVVILSIMQLRLAERLAPVQDHKPPKLEVTFPTGDTDPHR
jgi:hypothetical protein